MDLPQDLRFSVEDRPSARDREAVEAALVEFNRPYFRHPEAFPLGVFLRNAAGEIVAGLDGGTYADWLYVENLWVQADLRHRGIGSELLGRAERRAVERGCHSAWLDTFSFQAPEFYRRLGYEVYGTLDYPPNHQRFFLKKRLVLPDIAVAAKSFSVSVKGALLEDGRVVLLENERSEWELPGGRLEHGEEPAVCLKREFAEELGADVIVEAIVDCWVYEVLPQRDVLIVTYGVRRLDQRAMRVSGEHRRLGLFAVGELDGLPLPEGYRRSIRTWVAQRGIC